MNLWSELVKTSVIGTARAQLPAVEGERALDKLLKQAADGADSAEKSLLLQAGLITQFDQSGQLPRQTNKSITPPPPRSHTVRTSLLPQLLNGRFKEFVPTYLEGLIANGKQVDTCYLPNVLDYGSKTPTRSHLIAPAIGAHGRWLATQNPAWWYATVEATSAEGAAQHVRKLEEVKRPQFLRQLRHQNPDLARQIIDVTWRQGQKHARLGLIRALDVNLSVDDEPILEKALIDRNLMVRREAIRLLSIMPNSKLRQRMVKRTQKVLRWNAKEKQLDVFTPHFISPEHVRDGVPAKLLKKSQAMLREAQLTALIKPVPLNVWETHVGISAETLIAAIPSTNWPRTLTNAFSEATLMQRNARWARLLITHLGLTRKSAKLLAILQPGEIEAMARQYAHTSTNMGLRSGSPLNTMFVYAPLPWSPTLANLWLQQIDRYFATEESVKVTHSVISSLRRFARCCPIEQIDEAVAILLPFTKISAWRHKLHEAIGILRFRQQIDLAVKR